MWTVFISTSLTCDLTSGPRGVGHARQKCAMCVEVCARVWQTAFMPACTECACVLHMLFSSTRLLFQQPIGPSFINHTHHLSACVWFRVCFWIKGQHLIPITIGGDVLIFLRRSYAHLWTHTCAGKEQKEGWLIRQWRLGWHYKAEEDGGNTTATKEWES